MTKPDKQTDNINDDLQVKFLVIRLSSIGDIVLTTPVIRCLKQQVTNAKVHFLVKRQFIPVLKANPYLDSIHEYRGTTEALQLIKNHGFHYIIDLHNNLRTALIKSRSHVIAFSFNKLNIQKWLLVNLKRDVMPDVHIVDRYLDTIKPFDVVNDKKGLDYFISPDDEVNVNSLPELYNNGYILFAIGANHYTKRFPAEKIIALCKQINLPVILAGGPEDAERGDLIAESGGKFVLNVCGRYNINQSASLVRQASLVISHDTGLMHIAAAYKKKVISLWGNTIPRFGMAPYMSDRESAVFEVGGLKCRPCSKIGYSKCPRGHFKCMNEQDEKKIAGYARKLFLEPGY